VRWLDCAERWVLAAHCFKPTTAPGEVKAKAGATNYKTQGTWSDIEKVVIHEAYNPNTHEHDIALIKSRSRRKAGSYRSRMQHLQFRSASRSR
jgi:secreted trypsin-like serine protease